MTLLLPLCKELSKCEYATDSEGNLPGGLERKKESTLSFVSKPSIFPCENRFGQQQIGTECAREPYNGANSTYMSTNLS